MFIEEMWGQDPQLVKKALEKICNVDKDAGERLDFSGIRNGVLSCAKYGKQFCEIEVRDYDIKVAVMNRYAKSNELSSKWFKFMSSVLGEKYVHHYIEHRGKELDKIVDMYNNETAEMLESVDFELENCRTR